LADTGARDRPATGPVTRPVSGAITSPLPISDSIGLPQAIKHWKAIAASFDGLVRSIRSRGAQSQAIAKRTLDVWLEHPDSHMEVEATRAVIDGETGLTVGAVEGRWMLPVYMAGLRRIRPRSDAGVWEMLRLAEEVAQLEPDSEALAAFRDWLWADGAEGFEIDLQLSFMEVMESIAHGQTWEDWAVSSVRSLGAEVLDARTVRVSSRDLDAASVREQFQMSLDLFHRQARDGSLALSEASALELGLACDDSTGWAEIEMDAVLSHPELRATIPPDRLARRILSLISAHCDIRILQFLSTIGQMDDAYSKGVVGALEKEPLGDIIARHIVIDGPGAAALADCLSRAPVAISKGLLHGLLDRAAGDATLFDALSRIVVMGGAAKLALVIDPEALTQVQAGTLARLLASAPGGLPILIQILDRTGHAARAGLMASLPLQALVPLRDRVHALFAKASEDELTPLATALTAARRPAEVRLLGEVVEKTKGRRWNGKAFRAALATLATGDGSEVLVRMARSTAIAPEVRLLALRALDANPAALAAASRWRLAEYFDSAAVRERVREARRRLGGGS
jgi:hypothetical protein